MTKLFVDANASCKVGNEMDICPDGKNISLGEEDQFELDKDFDSQILRFIRDWFCKVFSRKHKTLQTQIFIPRDEYNNFQNMYKQFDKLNIPQELKETLCLLFMNADENIKQMFNKYASNINFLNVRFTKTSRFVYIDRGIRYNYKEDMTNVLGVGNTYYHEVSHLIDWHALKRTDFTSESYVGYNLQAMVQKDYHNAIKQIKINNNCDTQKAKELLSQICKNNHIYAHIVSDVFGGCSQNKVTGISGHPESYWNKNLPDLLGQEVFASITAAIICGDVKSIEFAKQYLPYTFARYYELVNQLINE